MAKQTEKYAEGTQRGETKSLVLSDYLYLPSPPPLPHEFKHMQFNAGLAELARGSGGLHLFGEVPTVASSSRPSASETERLPREA